MKQTKENKITLNKTSPPRNSVTDADYIYGIGNLKIIKGSNIAYIKADFDKDTLFPGDTVNVIVKKVDVFGNEFNFPSSTLFEVGIKEGCDIGNILTLTGELGQYFYGIPAPIRFVVNDSLSVDNADVSLRVGVPPNPDTTYLPYSLSSFANKTNPAMKGKMNKSVTDQSPEYCILNQFIYEDYGIAKSNAVNIKLEIIYPQKNSPNESIKKVAQMPTVTCKARLINYNSGLVTFEWEYWVSYTIERYERNYDSLCPRKGQIEFVGNSTAENEEVTKWQVPFVTDNIGFIQLVSR